MEYTSDAEGVSRYLTWLTECPVHWTNYGFAALPGRSLQDTPEKLEVLRLLEGKSAPELDQSPKSLRRWW